MKVTVTLTGNKITDIRIYRELTHKGLLASKRFIERQTTNEYEVIIADVLLTEEQIRKVITESNADPVMVIKKIDYQKRRTIKDLQEEITALKEALTLSNIKASEAHVALANQDKQNFVLREENDHLRVVIRQTEQSCDILNCQLHSMQCAKNEESVTLIWKDKVITVTNDDFSMRKNEQD